jgi:hypothetical protein
MKVDLPILSKGEQVMLIKEVIKTDLTYVYSEMDKLRNQMIDLNQMIKISQRLS